MRTHVFYVAISLQCICALSGCMSTNVAKFSFVATKEIDVSTKAEKVAQDIIGKNVHWFIIIDPTFSFPKIDAALNDALEKSGGDFMTDAVVSYNFFMVPVLYYRLWYEIKGDVWKTNSHGKGDQQRRRD